MDRADAVGSTPVAAAAALRVEVVFAPRPGVVDCVALQLPAGARVGDALHASGLLPRHGLELTAVRVGVWARQQPLEHVLRDRDRVEIYRPLTVDPKEARRLRYKQHRDKVADTAAAKR